MIEIKNSVERMMKKIRTSLSGVITSVKKDGTVFAKFSENEEIRDIKIISPYGLFSLPKNGLAGQIIFNNTSKKASLIGVEHSNLPVTIDIGEMIFYNPTGGNYIYLKNNGSVIIHGSNVSITGNSITANGEDLTTDNIGGM